MSKWQIENCIMKTSTDKQECDGCPDRHNICIKCGGPVFRVGSLGDGMSCYHCSTMYQDINPFEEKLTEMDIILKKYVYLIIYSVRQKEWNVSNTEIEFSKKIDCLEDLKKIEKIISQKYFIRSFLTIMDYKILRIIR